MACTPNVRERASQPDGTNRKTKLLIASREKSFHYILLGKNYCAQIRNEIRWSGPVCGLSLCIKVGRQYRGRVRKKNFPLIKAGKAYNYLMYVYTHTKHG